LTRWYAFAAAFVHPAISEPWGLVANEAAACGLPLLISERAGCVETLIPEGHATTGRRFDPRDEDAVAASLAWMAGMSLPERQELGARAASIAREWGPERFASGTIEALQMAKSHDESMRRTPRRAVVAG
jgi:glycosyltransferase involved in cell wall biosynthesis